MCYYKNPQLQMAVLLLLFFNACHQKEVVKEKEIVINPLSMNEYVRENIGQLLASGESNNGILDSTLQLKFFPVVQFYYSENDNVPLWSNTEKWTQPADSLLSYLQNAAYDGLFKADYHFDKLKVLVSQC